MEDLNRWTIEPHGDGYAIYVGRDHEHHGYNVAKVSEIDKHWDVIKAITSGVIKNPIDNRA